LKTSILTVALTCYLTCLCTTMYAQGKFLVLDASCHSSEGPTDAILTIDNRQENQIMGFVHTGITNQTKEVMHAGNLIDSLVPFFNGVNPDGKLVVMLNEFNLWEYRDGGEVGRFKLSLRIFKQVNDQFVEFMTHDSLYSVKGFDVTNKLLTSVSRNFCAVSDAAREEYIRTKDSVLHPIYSFKQLMVLDSLEKYDLPAFRDEQIREGIYANYQEFKANRPGDASEIESDARNPKSVKIYRVAKNDKRVRVKNEKIYAVCDGSKIFKSLSTGFYEMKRDGNDFYYVRPATVSTQANMGPVIAGGILGGAIGGAIAGMVYSHGANSGPLVLYKINHRRGNAIPLRRYDM
jgi:hypothetical protein